MRKTIDLEKGCGIWLKALAVEVSGIIGLRSFSLDFPVARPQGGIVIRTAGPGQEGIFEEGGRLIIMAENSRTSFEDICRRLAEDPASYLGTEDDGRRAKAPEDLIFSSDHPGEAGFAEKTCFGGLERLFDCGGFFRDLNGDGLPDSVDLKILIAEDLSDSQTAAACDLAARIGAQTLGYDWPLTSTDRKDGKTLRFESSGHASVTFDRESGDIVIKGDGEELTGFTADFCASFPAASPGSDWRDFIDELNKSLEMKSPDGQLAALSMAGGRGNCLFSPGAKKTEGLKERFPEASIRSFREPVPVPGYHMVFEPRWEVDRVLDLMKGGVLTALGPDDVVDVSLAVSEDRQVRSALSGQIGEMIEAAGARTGTIRTVCAYKQGFSWLDELVCPVLEGLGQKPGSLVIGYGQFLPGSGGEWMDLPIRLLQELYPIDDVLAQRLGISRDAVTFEPLECGGAPRYVVKALAKDGTLLYEGSFTPSYSERRYLDTFEDTALVHPCTGRLTVLVNGKKALDEMIPTDLELLWDFYQKEVLPACGRRIEEKCGGIPDPNLQPFFTQMRLDISVSEPDYSLPCRSDRLSSICAFHEDLYFAGLDYFNRLGLKKAGARLEAPGLILPVIRKAQGAPRMEFTLLENAADGPKLFSDGRQLIRPLGYRAELRSLSLSDGKKTSVIDLIEADRTEGPDGGDAGLRDFTESYAALLEEGLLRASSMLSAADLVVFEAGGAPAACARVPEKSAPAPLDIDDVDLHETELIGPETYEEIIEKLMRVPGIRVRRESESVQGRPIHSIEILPRSSGFTSEIQRIRRNPTVLMVSRHHANEVSSTNSAFMQLRMLLTDPSCRELADRLNIVMLPFENPDGAAVHRMLQEDNPDWQLHIARYNSVGREYAADYFDDGTMNTEALAFTRLFRRWAPDVIIDDHGIPCHEWDQQFSGYTSPPFRSFWMPRALLYGYLWQADHPDYGSNLLLGDLIEDAVASSLEADPRIPALNADWRDRYEKYAHGPMPDLFDARYFRDLISYRLSYPVGTGKYASVRFPWVVSAWFTSEVSDETARGLYLELCAKTHMLHDMAVLRMLAGRSFEKDERVRERGGGLKLTNIRKRPLF